VRGLVILVSAVAIACGQGATPTAPSPGIPMPAGDLKSSLSTSFDALAIPASAACSISISQQGQVLLERGRGQVAPGRPADGDSLYRIASLTKPITASAVLGYPFPSNTHPSWVYAAGGVSSTAADLNRFNQALLSNLFGFGAVESFDRSAAGVTSFGMGSGGGGSGDLRFTHAGGLDSYSSFSIIFPADRSSVVVLCSFNSNNPDGLFNFVRGIRSLMLGTR
jgi:CubicO group peptidase (beta-lactamase class C family)